MKTAAYWRTGVVLLTAVTAGCGKRDADSHTDHGHAGHDHAHHTEAPKHSDHRDESEGIRFVADRGLTFSAEVLKALDLKTAPVGTRTLTVDLKLLTHVFRTHPELLATASLPIAEAERLKQLSFEGARVVRLERTAMAATRMIDVIFALERDPRPAVGEYVTVPLRSASQNVLAVPRSSLLDAAAGTFVYLRKGEFYQRTAVKVGAFVSDDFTEITEGIKEGDVVVVSPVEQLWLTELRLTKGGGHSH